MANILKQGADAFGLLGIFTTPIQLGLLYWSRKSELSADRAAALISGNVQPVLETMIRLSGGPKSITEKIDVAEYAKQAEAYETLQEKKWDKVLQTLAIAYQDHPFASVRVNEIINWCNSEYFNRLIENIKKQDSGEMCSQCGKPVNKDWTFCEYCGHKLH